MSLISIILAVGLALSSEAAPSAQSPAQAPPPNQAAQPTSPIVEELFAAVRAGDIARVTAALDKGAGVNSTTRYGATALMNAADKGHVEIMS